MLKWHCIGYTPLFVFSIQKINVVLNSRSLNYRISSKSCDIHGKSDLTRIRVSFFFLWYETIKMDSIVFFNFQNWEVLNTAVLTGKQVSQAMKIFIVSQAGKAADVTFQASCHSEDDSVLKVINFVEFGI